jgi:uncharacterized protein (TIGR00251 family)
VGRTSLALTTHGDTGSSLRVRAQPGASRERIVGVHGDALKVAVSAPPERGRANERIAEVLAAALDVPLRAITLLSGATSRDKRFAIVGRTPEECRSRLAPFLDS